MTSTLERASRTDRPRPRRRSNRPSWVRSNRAFLVTITTLLAAVAVMLVMIAAGEPPASPRSSAPAAPFTIAPAGPAPVLTVAVIGDSYMKGEAGDSVPSRLGSRFNWSVTNTAVGGTGYVNGGAQRTPFEQAQLAAAVRAHPQLVIVYGSRNDMGVAGVQDAAAHLYRSLQTQLPGTRIVVVGPAWVNTTPTSEITAVRDDLRDAARAADVDFIDPIEQRWLGANPGWIGPDQVHPSQQGRQELARRFGEALTALGLPGTR